MQKITVDVPAGVLASAQAETGRDVAETVRAGLQALIAAGAQRKALALQGKIKFAVDLIGLRRLED